MLGGVGSSDEHEPAGSEDPVTAWSRLWDRQRAPIERAETDPEGPEPAESTIAHLRSLAEHPPADRREAPRRPRVRRRVLIVIAAVVLGGGPSLVSWLVASDQPTVPEAVNAPTSTDDEFLPTTMPDVLGARLPKATDLIVAADLELVDIRFVRGPAGRVVATEPTPGEAVTVGTDVLISVGTA